MERENARVILGTAGHIDHGKTALIKRLTGIDTDRLKEEKERGITIELGFAYLDLLGGSRLGIIDVPGHEKFVRHMVAGSGGIDIAALIIAADEGVMPQTVEHLNILRLLGIGLGLVVITKIDLVEREFVDLVEEEIREFARGSFLENAPIVRVSSITGEGIDLLLKTLADLTRSVEARITSGIFRLPIDRVFTMKGFGTVITGTLLSGGVRVGEEVEISPSGIKAKIRGIQVHGAVEKEARAGMRTAINLMGINKEEVFRGSVLISPGSIEPSSLIDAHLFYLSLLKKNLKNRAAVRFHIGTSEVKATVVLIEHDELLPGGETFAQLRLADPVIALPRDRFVIRSLSPSYTIGGGEVLHAHPKKHKRFADEVIEDFQKLTLGNVDERASVFLKDAGYPGFTVGMLARDMGVSPEEAREMLDCLVGREAAVLVEREKERYLDRASYERLSAIMISHLGQYHNKNPKSDGMGKEELLSRMPWGVDGKLLAALILDYAKKRAITVSGERISLPSHEVTFEKKEREVMDRAISMIVEAGLSPPSASELAQRLEINEGAIKKLLDVSVREGSIIRIRDGLYFGGDKIKELKTRLVSHLREKGEIDAQSFKEMTGVSRKYAIPLLEYFDGQKVTMRIGDVRRLRERASG